jgi:hypothetical protein
MTTLAKEHAKKILAINYMLRDLIAPALQSFKYFIAVAW